MAAVDVGAEVDSNAAAGAGVDTASAVGGGGGDVGRASETVFDMVKNWAS
jgi:hypothetical protein